MLQGFSAKEVTVMKAKTNFKTTTILLAIALFLFGVVFATQRTGWLTEKLSWENGKTVTKVVVDGLKAEVREHQSEAERLKGLADGYQNKAIGLEDKLAKQEKQEEKRQDSVDKMAVEEVAEETRRVLNVDESEVWANELGLQFSLSGSQENLKVLFAAEYAWLKAIPSLSSQRDMYKKGLGTMFTAFEEEKKALNISFDKIVFNLEIQIDNDTKYIKKLHRRLTLVRWKNLAIGVGITFVVIKLIEILK